MTGIVQDRDQAVRELAYFLWEKAGRPSGQEHAFWAQASKEIEGEPKNDNGAALKRFVAR